MLLVLVATPLLPFQPLPPPLLPNRPPSLRPPPPSPPGPYVVRAWFLLFLNINVRAAMLLPIDFLYSCHNTPVVVLVSTCVFSAVCAAPPPLPPKPPPHPPPPRRTPAPSFRSGTVAPSHSPCCCIHVFSILTPPLMVIEKFKLTTAPSIRPNWPECPKHCSDQRGETQKNNES